MTDMTDDWMNPQRSVSWTLSKPHADGTFYIIQRKRAIPVSGNVSEIHRWDQWEEFKSREERDGKLEYLRKEHPMWVLRARTIRYHNGEGRIEDPGEHMDF